MNNDLLQSKIDLILDMEEDLILILNKSGFITRCNSSGLQMLEYKDGDILNQHIVDLVATKYKEDTLKAFNDLIGGKPERAFEAAFLSIRGKEILFSINARPINHNGSIGEILLLGKNINRLKDIAEEIENLKIKLIEANRLLSIERQRANQRKSLLEELNRMKSEFVSNISHELRTPLASIIGFSETIASDPDMPDEMRSEFNSTILNEGKRLARLINDVLDISKLEGGKIAIVKFKFDAIAMLHEVVELYIKNARVKNIIFTCDFPEEEIQIDGDKEKIAQTIGRLLNNAIKFTNEKGRIKIIAKNLFKEIEIIITDTGIGIPAADLPFIFQKFYRVSRPGTEIPGTGLGLVFVKQIIDLHKGFVTVQSELGKGTTFAIKLPKNNL
jgi:PAS domain S-box-containing protein